MSQAASKFVEYGASTTTVLVSATANAAGIEEQNAQHRKASGGQAKEASAFDVWTHTAEGLAEGTSQPAGARQSTLGDSLSGRRSQEYDATVDGMTAQIGNVTTEGANLLGLGKGESPSGVLGTVAAGFGLLTSIEQTLSMPLAMIPFPAFPALRITDMDIGLPHAHSHPPNLIPPAPPVPLPSTGPVIPIPFLSGAVRTLINGMPAARCGDMGLGIWCGGYFPMYEVFLGSSSVWIEGSRAARLAVDITKHCTFSAPKPTDPPMGPMIGFTITASPNVLIGGVPLPSLLNFAMGAAVKGLFKGIGKLVGVLKKLRGGRALRVAEDMTDEVTQVTRRPPPQVKLTPWLRALAEELHTPGMRRAVKEISTDELAQLTRATKDEWAVVMSRKGKLEVVRGAGRSTSIEKSDVLLAHTHPRGTPTPSEADLLQAASSTQAATPVNPAIVTPDGKVFYYNANGQIPSEQAIKPHDSDFVFR